MKHTHPPLPFPKNALEPHMSSETLEFHHGKHHKAYVDKLNQLIVGTEFENSTLEEIIRKASGPIFNNAAQAWNHSFFWDSLSPQKQEPGPQLKEALTRDFGSVDQFMEKFTAAAAGVFGSGWAWLVRNDQGQLVIETTSNADTPIRTGKTVLLTADVWEHAYYIDYRNERPRYLKALGQILNWKFAERNFAEKTAAA